MLKIHHGPYIAMLVCACAVVWVLFKETFGGMIVHHFGVRAK